MMQGNTALVDDLVVHFVHNTPQLIDRFEASLDSGDWNALFGTTQRLMSSFRLLQETDAIDSLRVLSEERVNAMTAKERSLLCQRLRAVVEAFA